MIIKDEAAYFLDTEIELSDNYNDMVDEIYASIKSVRIPNKRYADTEKDLIRVVLTNLIHAEKSHPFHDIAYSRNAGDYNSKNSQNNVSKKIIKVIDWMTATGYIQENRKGFNDRKSKGKESYTARMRPGQKVLDYMSRNDFTYVRPKRPYSALVMKDDNKTIIDFVETAETQRMRNNLQFINNHIETYKVELLADDNTQDLLEWVVKNKDKRLNKLEFEELPFFDDSKIKLYRSFNNNSFEKGGRFYGHWVQDVFAKVHKFRNYLSLNGQPVVELDFSNMHPYMIYQFAEKQPPAGDLYQIDIDNYAEERQLVKKVFNAMLNAEGKSIADAKNKVISSITKDQTGGYHDIETRDRVESYMEKLVEKHKAIEDLFFTGIAKKCQRLDSDIAELVMLDLMSRNIPVIPIHDSFITQRKHENDLHETMQKAYKQVIGMEPPAIDKKKNDPIEWPEDIMHDELSAGYQKIHELNEAL